MALLIVKYRYSVDSFDWISIIMLSIFPSIVFTWIQTVYPVELIELLHSLIMTLGCIALLFCYVLTLLELKQLRFNRIESHTASRVMIRLIMSYSILHIIFYLPHIISLWCSSLKKIPPEAQTFLMLYEWYILSLKGFLHALCISFVLVLIPTKFKQMKLKNDVDFYKDTVVAPSPLYIPSPKLLKEYKVPQRQYEQPSPRHDSDTMVDSI
jgi:hypothetical protein